MSLSCSKVWEGGGDSDMSDSLIVPSSLSTSC